MAQFYKIKKKKTILGANEQTKGVYPLVHTSHKHNLLFWTKVDGLVYSSSHWHSQSSQENSRFTQKTTAQQIIQQIIKRL